MHAAFWVGSSSHRMRRHDQPPLWLPGSSHPAIPASRHRGLTLTTMRRDGLHAMVGGKKERTAALEIHVMAQGPCGHEYFDMDAVKRITGFAATAGQQAS
jgi:hypothetical protein